MMRTRLHWLPLVAATLGAGCVHAGPTAGPVAGTPRLDPRLETTLGPSDLFDVRVYGETELSGTYRVHYDGTIDFPLIGQVDVKGKTPSEAAKVIAGRLAGGYLLNPQVTVLVKEYNSKKIIVIGQVKTPGTFPFLEDMTVLQAITLAGGFNDLAAKNDTTVTRMIDGREVRLRVRAQAIAEGREPNVELRPGDRVWVPERIF